MEMLKQLKEKLEQKIDDEFEELKEDLKKCKPEVIIERAYEIVSKEEMTYVIKAKNYSIQELKALLKTDGILEECYDEWLKTDANFNELLEYAVDKRTEIITNDFIKEKAKKSKESR